MACSSGSAESRVTSLTGRLKNLNKEKGDSAFTFLTEIATNGKWPIVQRNADTLAKKVS